MKEKMCVCLRITWQSDILIIYVKVKWKI